MMFVTVPLLVDWCSNQVSFSLYHSMYMYIYVEWVTLVWCEREGSRVRSEHSDRVWKAGVRSVHTVSMTKTPRFEANHRVVRMHFHCDWHNVVIMYSLSLPVFYYRACWSSCLLLTAIYTRRAYVPRVLHSLLTCTSHPHSIRSCVDYFPTNQRSQTL